MRSLAAASLQPRCSEAQSACVKVTAPRHSAHARTLATFLANPPTPDLRSCISPLPLQVNRKKEKARIDRENALLGERLRHYVKPVIDHNVQAAQYEKNTGMRRKISEHAQRTLRTHKVTRTGTCAQALVHRHLCTGTCAQALVHRHWWTGICAQALVLLCTRAKRLWSCPSCGCSLYFSGLG